MIIESVKYFCPHCKTTIAPKMVEPGQTYVEVKTYYCADDGCMMASEIKFREPAHAD